MKRLLTLFFIIIISCNAYGGDLNLNAQSAVLIDANSGRVLWGRNESKPMAMASTTKIMTAIIAIENSNLKESVIVGKNPVMAPKVKMNLQTGEVILLEHLLYALLMQSSNDAAVAIAEHISRDVDTFCKAMTDKAREIGCKDTVFETPNGLDKGNHHSTAYDMALISAYAIKNPEFIRISNTRKVNFQTNKNTYSITNKNQFLDTYSGAIGIKTGFTGKAGHCFAGAAKKGDITLVSVVLACGWGASGKAKKWSDTKKLMDYGFNNYKIYSLEPSSVGLKVARSKDTLTTAIPEGYIEALLKNDKSDTIRFKNVLPDTIIAPVNKGDKLGYTELYVNGHYIDRTELLASESIAENSFSLNFNKIYKDWLGLLCL